MSTLEEQRRLLTMGADEARRSSFFPVRPKLLRLKQTMARHARALIKAERADELVSALPREASESTHALLSGEFVLGDLIDRLRAAHGEPRALWISTLSVGLPNLATLTAAAAAGVPITLLVSHYFQSTDKELFSALDRAVSRLAGFRLVVGRLHAKVLLFDFDGWPLTITASANLRSSGNLEQLDAFADPALFFFHQGWMQDVAERASKGSNPAHYVHFAGKGEADGE